MNFEIDPPDEPCPDCGSSRHRQCQVLSQKNFYTQMRNAQAEILKIEQKLRDEGYVNTIHDCWEKIGETE